MGWACDAFERGIPTEVLASVKDHRTPIDGDGGLTYEPKKKEAARDVAPRIATDPPVSEAQRRAMWAAASGHGTSGIPASVGREFASADPGGKLPATARDMSRGGWQKILSGLTELAKFFSEEKEEPAHQGAEDDWSPEARAAAAEARKKSARKVTKSGGVTRIETKPGSGVHVPLGKFSVHKAENVGEANVHNIVHHTNNEKQAMNHAAKLQEKTGYLHLSAHSEYLPGVKGANDTAWDSWERKGKASSVAFTTSDGRVLLLKRAHDEKNWPDTWAFPGGKADPDEDDEACARRESTEECGDCTFDGMAELERTRTPNDFEHVTYVVPVKEPFNPKLSGEHSGFAWYPATDLPDPVHPGVRAAIDRVINTKIASDEWSDAARKAAAEARRKKAKHHEQVSEPHLTSAKSTSQGSFSERERAAANPNAAARADKPKDVFLLPAEEKYPVKVERDGSWKYDRGLLLAAAREARMHSHEDLAKRADEIREREFPDGAKDAAVTITDKHGNAMTMDSSGVRFYTVSPLASDMAVDWDAVAEHAILAYDKSVRQLDTDGRMHVDEANICQGKVDEYYGDEVNGAMGDEAGWVPLDPKCKYKLYRDPKELAKPETVKSANGIPILGEHAPTDAKNHKFSETIGSTGTTARFDHPFIKNGLNFWPQKAIDDIDDGSKAQLSPGYRYKVDMTPGTTPDGEPYHGRMHSIRFNHLASVPQGRQGSKVVVPDADPDWRAWATLERAILDMGQSASA